MRSPTTRKKSPLRVTILRTWLAETTLKSPLQCQMKPSHFWKTNACTQCVCNEEQLRVQGGAIMVGHSYDQLEWEKPPKERGGPGDRLRSMRPI